MDSTSKCTRRMWGQSPFLLLRRRWNRPTCAVLQSVISGMSLVSMAESGSFASAASSLRLRALIGAMTPRARRLARGDDTEGFFAIFFLIGMRGRRDRVYPNSILPSRRYRTSADTDDNPLRLLFGEPFAAF